jgi:hypothetical protein
MVNGGGESARQAMQCFLDAVKLFDDETRFRGQLLRWSGYLGIAVPLSKHQGDISGRKGSSGRIAGSLGPDRSPGL